jgi:hypothetical protein
MKTDEGVEVQLHAFLITALNEGKRSASRPDHFTPEEVTTTLIAKEIGYVPEEDWTL